MSEYSVHPTSVVDDNVEIGAGTKIWHFCHIQSGARIGRNCSFGQNVNVSNNVKIGDGCKVYHVHVLFDSGGPISWDHYTIRGGITQVILAFCSPKGGQRDAA